MYLNIDFKLTPQIEEQIKQETMDAACELLLKNPEELKKLVRECVKGCLKANINDILQTKDYREFLRDKIAEEIGLEE